MFTPHLARLLRRATILLLAILTLTVIGTHSAQAAEQFPPGSTAYVLLNDTEFYSQADYASPVLSRLPHGARFVIANAPQTPPSGVTWYNGQVNGVNGWLPADDLAANPNAAAPAVVWPQPPAATPVPPTAAPAIPAIVRDGTSRGVAVASDLAAVAGRVVSTALPYKGYRYIWGGTTPKGFDCSGFTYYVFNKAGVKLPRSMSEQINSGARIKAADLRAGDLVYFQNTAKRGISHIALYIGNGKILHAANENTGVIISDLWSAYWAAHYAGSVRVLR